VGAILTHPKEAFRIDNTLNACASPEKTGGSLITRRRLNLYSPNRIDLLQNALAANAPKLIH
jgi:hypothetical protein